MDRVRERLRAMIEVKRVADSRSEFQKFIDSGITTRNGRSLSRSIDSLRRSTAWDTVQLRAC